VSASVARVAILGMLAFGGALGTAGATAPAGDPADDSLPCVRTLRALDAAGRPLFQSPAVALAEPGRAALPLHPLERGGARWERLEITGPGLSPVAVNRFVAVEAAVNLAIVEADGLAACSPPPQAPGPLTGAAIRVARERAGYRPAVIGGHVERLVSFPGGASLALVRLLDDGGADPGLVFDAQGGFLGATLPAPTPAAPSLAAFMPWDGAIPAATGANLPPGGTAALPHDGAAGDGSPRAALPPRNTATAATTDAGLVAYALLGAGPDAAERGLALLDDVIGRDGESASLLVERGVLHFKANRVTAAIADFERAVALAPALHVARFNLGIALGTAGRYAEAALALRAARDLDPRHTRTRYQLVLALKAARRTDEARRECADLEAIDPRLASDLRATIGL
jgi:tetratricopeptide repeat protein